jgi:hypothetical protein
MMRANNKHQTHQKGAIGFAQVFDLIDRIPLGDRDLFVLPIDVCDAFLGILGGGSGQSREQLADAILLELNDQGLTLCPIEIKLYDLENPLNQHPSKSAEAMTGPKNQSSATSRKLLEISNLWMKSVGLPDPSHLLLANGVASLLEVAMKLSPHETKDRGVTANRLRRLADGELNLTVGESIITYLAATNNADNISVHTSPRRAQDPRGHVIFMADPRRLARAEADTDHEVLEKWNRVIDLALGTSNPIRSTIQSGPAPTFQNDEGEGNVESSEVLAESEAEENTALVPENSLETVDVMSPTLLGDELNEIEEESVSEVMRTLRNGGVRFKIGEFD